MMKYAVYILFCTLAACCFYLQPAAQTNNQALYVNKFPAEGLVLDSGWKLMKGDNKKWSATDYNDTAWKAINPALDVTEYRQLIGNDICWLRFHISLDSSFGNQPVYLHIVQNAATEIYLDGKPFIQYGKVSANRQQVKAYNPINQSVPLVFDFSGQHVIAVRLCLPNYITDYAYPSLNNALFKMRIGLWSQQQQRVDSFHNSFGMTVSKAAIFIIVLLLHFAFYFVYRKEKVNLWLGVFDLFNAAGYVLYALLVYKIHDVDLSNMLRIPGSLFFTIGSWFLLLATYSGFYLKRGFWWWFFFIFMVATIALYFTPFNDVISQYVNPQIFIYPFLASLESIRLSYLSLRKKNGKINPLAQVMIFCVLSCAAAVVALQVKDFGSEDLNSFFSGLISVALLGLPISFFMYVAIEFRYFYNKLVRAQELKTKISLDLHDDLGTKLSTARMFLRSIKGSQTPKNTTLLGNAISLIDNSIMDLRLVMNDLESPTLIDKGYMAATEELVNRINDLQEINFTLSANVVGKRMDQKAEYNLFRITQELINNTLKYAHAKNVSIELVNRDDKIIFMYEDDGKGFDLTTPAKGYGLSNITTRSQALNAELEFDSKPGAGFRTIIEFPLVYA
ncbi:sensor histidine kinase [Panacibacter sp. DH6]|uniref:histidine kinase n=1 Tax=Panacibacter microcysteis TaxID=2793269 RepID=A0A931GYF9_9BACT|nr:sensor histidine kinase [Panacibacter microcysteis]MBG9375792.1 sensor histidine kinase [Panacibacter microcysteis]